MIKITCPVCGNTDLDGELDLPDMNEMDAKHPGWHEDLIRIEAKREDVKFLCKNGDIERECSVSVLQPLLTCGKCKQSWTDMYSEVLREFAVNEARENELKLIKDCPCCGMKQSTHAMDLIDSLHPTGSYWTEEEGMRHYWNPQSEGKQPKIDGKVWKYSCRTTAGGCGLTILGDSCDDVLQKWNRRNG